VLDSNFLTDLPVARVATGKVSESHTLSVDAK